MKLRLAITFWCVFFPLVSPPAASWEQIAQKRDRCADQFERARQLMSTFEAAADRFRSLRPPPDKQSAARAEQFGHSLQVKHDYLRNRLDRIRNLSEKTRSDIETQRRQSSSCPDCIASSIDLFCRQVESLIEEIGEQIGAIRDFERAMGSAAAGDDAAQGKGASDTTGGIEHKIERARRALETGPNERAEKMLLMAVQHHEASLKCAREGEPDEARKQAVISDKLADKALELLEAGANP